MSIFPRMLRIMKISKYFGIFLYKLTRNWITIALTSPLWTNRTGIASSLILHSLVTQEEKAKKGLDLAVEIKELCKMMV